MKNWNYNSAASYFVTLCIDGRLPQLGKISNKQMVESEMGRVVREEWFKTPSIRPDMNISLGEFVVMPDHFHAILDIGVNSFNKASARERLLKWRDNQERSEYGSNEIETFGPQRKNLASVVRGFKSAVTQYARRRNIEFKWQSRYHEKRIFSQKEREEITDYIRGNPALWGKDIP